jgi:hypothetical protein
MTVIVTLSVDDLIIRRNKTRIIEDSKVQLHEFFEMMDLGMLNCSLGMEMW